MSVSSSDVSTRALLMLTEPSLITVMSEEELPLHVEGRLLSDMDETWVDFGIEFSKS